MRKKINLELPITIITGSRKISSKNMYLLTIILSLVVLFIIDWRIALPVAVIIFCLDRVMDNYRREIEDKINKR